MRPLDDDQLQSLLDRIGRPGFANRKLLVQLIGNYRATLSYRDQVIYLLMAAHEEAGFSFRNVNPDFQLNRFFQKSTSGQQSPINTKKKTTPKKDSDDDDAEEDDDKSEEEDEDKSVEGHSQEDMDQDEQESFKTKQPGADQRQDQPQKQSIKANERKKKKTSDPSPLIVFLRQFNVDQFKKSILAMPDDLRLDEITDHPDKSLYDVRFFLSAFFQLLNDVRVDGNEFVEQNCLSMVLSCICLADVSIRRAAYSVLNLFHKRCTGNYGRLWQLLLDKLRCTMKSETAKQFPAIIVSSLIHLIPFIHKPTCAVYIRLAKFLAQSPPFKFNLTMEFVRDLLVQTEDLEPSILYQNAALIIMRKGLRTELDCRLCVRVGLIDLLLNLFHSPLLADSLKPSILDVFDRLVTIEPAARQLCVEKAFLLWTSQLMFSEDKCLNTLDKINHILIKLENHGHDFYPQFKFELDLTRNTCSQLIDRLL